MSSPPLPPDIVAQASKEALQAVKDTARKTSDTLREIATFLANAPLYRRYQFTGSLWCSKNSTWLIEFPTAFKLFCPDPDCQRAQTWNCRDAEIYASSRGTQRLEGFRELVFSCRNCARSRLSIFLMLNITPSGGEITKVGQYPALYREADPVVVAKWGKKDIILYRKALTFRNANEGIAALPYLRRIIENHMRDIIDLIADSNTRRPINGFDETILNVAKTSRRFSDKLDFARAYLPHDLTPQGQPNPIGVLYELISEGLHERSEDECGTIFDKCKAAFEYVVRKLTEAKREDEDYVDALRTLNRP